MLYVIVGIGVVVFAAGMVWGGASEQRTTSEEL